MSEDSTSTTSQAKELTGMMANLGEANAIEWDCLLSCKKIHWTKVCGTSMSTQAGLEKAKERHNFNQVPAEQHARIHAPSGPTETADIFESARVQHGTTMRMTFGALDGSGCSGQPGVEASIGRWCDSCGRWLRRRQDP